jgi:hypothetical protein
VYTKRPASKPSAQTPRPLPPAPLPLLCPTLPPFPPVILPHCPLLPCPPRAGGLPLPVQQPAAQGAAGSVPPPAGDVHQIRGPRPARLLLRPPHPPHRRLPHRQVGRAAGHAAGRASSGGFGVAGWLPAACSSEAPGASRGAACPLPAAMSVCVPVCSPPACLCVRASAGTATRLWRRRRARMSLCCQREWSLSWRRRPCTQVPGGGGFWR